MTTSIKEFYRNKHIFITGVTGFMGKILLEKLLRCCDDVTMIYVLVRAKKGKDSKQRIEELLKAPIFDGLKATSSDIFTKIRCISGDILKDNLDLSLEERDLLMRNVEIVFHMAANVRFDQPMKTALKQNTGGTLNVLNLVGTFKHLKGFVHVSTSYCHCDQEILEERIYSAPQPPLKMLDWVDWMDEEHIETLTPKLLKDAPNTYAYTKCLTEELVADYAKRLPIAIARPSIVIGCVKEPIPGWIDNMNGPVGLMVGAGKGIIRSMHGNPNLPTDLVPVDLIINALIVIGKELAENALENEPMVVNLTLGQDNEITWGEVIKLAKKHFYENPFSVCLWYPGGGLQSNYIIHMLTVIFFHTIPAYLVDFLMLLTRNKPFLVRVQGRIQDGMKMLDYYTRRPWQFRNDRIREICDKLEGDERQMFNVDFAGIDWNQYILDSVKGARLYCVKESPETIPKAKKLLQKLFYLDCAKNLILFALVIWFFYIFCAKVFECTENIANLSVF